MRRAIAMTLALGLLAAERASAETPLSRGQVANRSAKTGSKAPRMIADHWGNARIYDERGRFVGTMRDDHRGGLRVRDAGGTTRFRIQPTKPERPTSNPSMKMTAPLAKELRSSARTTNFAKSGLSGFFPGSPRVPSRAKPAE